MVPRDLTPTQNTIRSNYVETFKKNKHTSHLNHCALLDHHYAHIMLPAYQDPHYSQSMLTGVVGWRYENGVAVVKTLYQTY